MHLLLGPSESTMNASTDSPSPGQKTRQVWTPEEDRILSQAVAGETSKHGPISWHKVAAHLPGRNNKDCRKRWHYSIANTIRKGTWMREEDEKLREAVEMYGTRWSKIAEAVGTRNGDQCWKRWYDCLDPRIDKSPWTTAEDTLLLQLVAQNGRNWSDIVHRHFPNRTSLSAKNRYSILRRKQTSAGSSPKKSSNNSSPSVSTTRFTPSSSSSSNSFLNIPTTPCSISRSTSATPEPDSLDMEALNFDWMVLTEAEVDELLYQDHQMGPLSATARPQIGYDSSLDSAPGTTTPWAASSTTTTAWAPPPNLGFDPNVAGALSQPPAAQSHAGFHEYAQQQQQQQQSQLQERSQDAGCGYNMPGAYQTGHQTQRTWDIAYDMRSNGLITYQPGMGSWHGGYGTGW